MILNLFVEYKRGRGEAANAMIYFTKNSYKKILIF